MATHPNDYIKPELMACCGAREILNDEVVLVGTGFPTMSANIARFTHAPNARLMQESGVYDAQPKRPALSVGDPCLNPGAAMIGGLVDIMGMFLQAGWVDVGFLSGSQVDKFGNINTTCIGDYENPKARLPGSGGANPIGSLCKRVLIIALHDARRLAERVDFITTPGYIDGSGARANSTACRPARDRTRSSPTRPCCALTKPRARRTWTRSTRTPPWTRWSRPRHGT